MTVDTVTGEVTESPTPYQLLPRLSDDEYAALKADIAENGIRVPIDVDEFGTILDGHHRSWIAADLNITCPQRRVEGLDAEGKRAHAIAVNIHRRNLTGEQRRDLILRMRGEGMSTRTIVESIGVSKGTVDRAIASVPAPAPNGAPAGKATTGRDGKTYPDAATISQRREQVAHLRSLGHTQAQIASLVGVAETTVQNDLKALEPVEAEPDVTGRTNADKVARINKIRELASSGHSSRQIADVVGRSDSQVRAIARENDIEITADKVVGKRRRIDSNHVMQSIVDDLEQLALPMRIINADDLDATRADEWVNSLRESIRALNRFVSHISKELTQ